MSRILSAQEIKKTFKNLKLKKNSSIFLSNELFRLGKIEGLKNSSDNYKTYLDTTLNYLGKNGTLSMNTYNFETLRFNRDCNLSNNITSAGKLSEIFLRYKGIVRSVHPVFSISSLGKKKKFICSNNSQHNYGKNSPFDRMLKVDTTIVKLGGSIVENPFLHCAEFAIGVPYFYNKIFSRNLIKNKKKINKKFVFFIRYENLKFKYNYKKIENLLLQKKILKKAKLGSGFVSICKANFFYNEIIQILKKDIHGLLEKVPNYKKTELPIK